MNEQQMTLGDLISRLKTVPANRKLQVLKGPKSYRGRHDELAFVKGDDGTTAGTLLLDCIKLLGGKFTGFKGGIFIATAQTPIWIVPDSDRLGDKLVEIYPELSVAEDTDF